MRHLKPLRAVVAVGVLVGMAVAFGPAPAGAAGKPGKITDITINHAPSLSSGWCLLIYINPANDGLDATMALGLPSQALDRKGNPTADFKIQKYAGMIAAGQATPPSDVCFTGSELSTAGYTVGSNLVFQGVIRTRTGHLRVVDISEAAGILVVA